MWINGGGEGSFWAMQRRRHHQRRARSSGSAQAFEGPVDRGRHCQQAAAALARQQRHQPRAHLQQLLQRRWRRQLRQLPAAPPLEARGGSQCEPPDPGRLGPRSAGGCRRFNLQQPTLGRSAKGGHGPCSRVFVVKIGNRHAKTWVRQAAGKQEVIVFCRRRHALQFSTHRL